MASPLIFSFIWWPSIFYQILYFQNDLLQWLKLLNLDYYHDTLLSQGYTTIDQVTEITWEDLEEIGIKLLGKSFAAGISTFDWVYRYVAFDSSW